jgi:hypothetical protein
MSAGQPPSPDELADQFPITPDEAQSIADAMSPLQDLAGAGGSFGSALENAPGAGPQLVGTILQNIAAQVNLASNSAEAAARAIDFYVTAQSSAFDELFPPPNQIAAQLEQDAEALSSLTPPGEQQPFE